MPPTKPTGSDAPAGASATVPTAGSGPLVRVVTVSASFGAEGRIASRLAKRLALPFADRLIPARPPASHGTVDEQLSDEEREECAKSSFLARLAHLTGSMGMPVPSAEVLGNQVQKQVEASIHELANTTGAVILGRGAAIVLAERPAVFHVRLDGPEDRRVARAAGIQQIDEAVARRQMAETDHARTLYIKRLYGRDLADPRMYHLNLDTTVFAIADCVEIIASSAEAFWRGFDSATSSRNTYDDL